VEVVIEYVDRGVRERRGRECGLGCLTSETVKSATLSLESVDNIEGGNSLSLSVLCVCDGITDDTFEEGLENTTGLFVNHGRDTLDTTTTRETSNRRLCDTLDVVTKNLAVTLGSSLAETLSALSACEDVRVSS